MNRALSSTTAQKWPPRSWTSSQGIRDLILRSYINSWRLQKATNSTSSVLKLRATAICFSRSPKHKTDISSIIHRSSRLMIDICVWLEVRSQTSSIWLQDNSQSRMLMKTITTLISFKKSTRWWSSTQSKQLVSIKRMKMHITRLFLRWRCRSTLSMPLVVCYGKSVSMSLAVSLKVVGVPTPTSST